MAKKNIRNRYYLGKQPLYDFNLGAGYIILRYSRSRVRWWRETLFRDKGEVEVFRKWLLLNHLPDRITITHAAVCYVARDSIKVSERLKMRGGMIRSVGRAYPRRIRKKLIVLKPLVAYTRERASTQTMVCAHSRLNIKVKNPFEYMAAQVNKVYPGRIPDTDPFRLAMNKSYEVDHSVHWERN